MNSPSRRIAVILPEMREALRQRQVSDEGSSRFREERGQCKRRMEVFYG
jgi:hypothetical protein